jgi:glucose uptake protein GlcU
MPSLAALAWVVVGVVVVAIQATRNPDVERVGFEKRGFDWLIYAGSLLGFVIHSTRFSRRETHLAVMLCFALSMRTCRIHSLADWIQTADSGR